MSIITDQLRYLEYKTQARLLANMADQEINTNRKPADKYIRWLRQELRQLWKETTRG